MKLMIIGSVAAGTSVGAKARRNSEELQITIYDRDQDIRIQVAEFPTSSVGRSLISMS